QGLLAVYQVSSLGKYIPKYDQEITFENTDENWQVILLDETLELEAGSKYYFEFQAFETWGTTYIGSPKRHRESKYNYWINPIKFTSWDNSKSKNYNCSSSTDKVVTVHSSSNEMLVQDFTACADGYLKTILVGGELEKTEVLDWFIRDQNELILDNGQATFEDYENGIITIATNLPVVNNFNYDLVLVSNPETANTLYLAETSKSIHAAQSDLQHLEHSLLVQFSFEELEIELAEDPTVSKALMNVYPNPFTDSFQVNIEGIDEECLLTLYDFSGNEVWMERVESSNEVKVLAQIDSNLSKGYYTLRMDFKSQVLLETLIKN
ncbi:MAG: T9SS type A sorting domain-containing protein, partial [Flavobacteriales bacterium]